MKAIVILAALMVLHGCSAMDEAPQAGQPLLASKSCSAIAQQRMIDAQSNGYGPEDQKRIFDYTYADCVKYEPTRQASSQP